MKKILLIVSFIGLGLVICPAILYLAGTLDKPPMKHLMLIGTVLWFVSVPFWMRPDKS